MANWYVCGIKVDPDNVGTEFEEEIVKAFEKQFPNKSSIDKLKFIDFCVKDMHKFYSDTTSVRDFVKSKVESEIDKTGNLNLNGLLNLSFIEQAYNLGKRNYKLYAPYSEDVTENYKALQLIYRIIEAVVNCDSQQRMFFYVQIPESDWIYNEKGEMVCGNCGEQNFELVKYNYCPECGAKMKGDSEDEDSGSINAGTV